MPWLRVDDGFTEHRKIIELGNPTARWTWLEILTYCARRRNGGHVPPSIGEVIKRATPTFIARCVDVGLLDENGNGHHVHDWSHYNPKDPAAVDRMAKNRATLPRLTGGKWEAARIAVFDRDQGSCTDCGKDCKEPKDGRDLWNADHDPPRDQLVQAGISIYDIDHIVTRCHSCHSKKTRREANKKRTIDRTESEPNSHGSVSSRAAARARPVPNPFPEVTTAALEARTPAAAEEEIQRLQRAGWSRSQVATVTSEADAVRATAWLEHAEHDPTIRAAGAFAWTQYQAGHWPPAEHAEVRPPDPSKRCDDCGATYGEGHEDDCPKVARARKAAVA